MIVGGKGRVGRTFGKESCIIVDKVTTQEPSIAEFIVSFYQLDSVTFG